MQAYNDGRVGTRGTILVASCHPLFTDLVGEMVTRAGFVPAYAAGKEASWLSLTRTQPCIVICDCSAPAEGIQSLIVDAAARDIPLVLSDARMQRRVDEGSLVLPQAVAWLTFPVAPDAFAAMLDALLSSHTGVAPRAPARVAPATIPSAVSRRARSLVLVPRDSADDETPALADARDLRSVIATALGAKPVYAESLRRAVWTYVGAERDAGASPGEVIVTLSELVESARIVPVSVSRALTRRVIVWCVEAYFGQLGCDVGNGSGVGMGRLVEAVGNSH